MKVPNGFINNIANYFYDKTFTVYTSSEVVDDEGWASINETATTNTFTGNINFDRLEEVQKEYGIDEEIDATISTHEDIENGTILKYDADIYKVIQAIPYDTHNILIIKKWLQE